MLLARLRRFIIIIIIIIIIAIINRLRKCPSGSPVARSTQNAPDTTSFIFCGILAMPSIPCYRLANDNV